MSFSIKPKFVSDKVSTGKTTIRVFPTAPTITYSLRTNEWYDQMIETVCNPDVRQRTTEDEILEMFCGHKSFCRLRDLSVIASSIHGTRMHAQEIKNNIALIRMATADIEQHDFNQQLKLFYTGMNAFKKQECLVTTEKSSFGSTYLSVLFVGKVRFTVSDGKMLDDGCVAFEDGQGTLEAGFIRAIQHSNCS
ncbi:unnamed protein product, partial [Rotaria sordida]